MSGISAVIAEVSRSVPGIEGWIGVAVVSDVANVTNGVRSPVFEGICNDCTDSGSIGMTTIISSSSYFSPLEFRNIADSDRGSGMFYLFTYRLSTGVCKLCYIVRDTLKGVKRHIHRRLQVLIGSGGVRSGVYRGAADECLMCVFPEVDLMSY